jgi:hypothetical protein
MSTNSIDPLATHLIKLLNAIANQHGKRLKQSDVDELHRLCGSLQRTTDLDILEDMLVRQTPGEQAMQERDFIHDDPGFRAWKER